MPWGSTPWPRRAASALRPSCRRHGRDRRRRTPGLGIRRPGRNFPDELSNLIAAHPRRAPGPDDIESISILINQKCNFTCRYCYSAGGRSKSRTARRALRTAYRMVRKPTAPRSLGGRRAKRHLLGRRGDLTLSMPKVRRLIGMFRARAAEGMPLRAWVWYATARCSPRPTSTSSPLISTTWSSPSTSSKTSTTPDALALCRRGRHHPHPLRARYRRRPPLHRHGTKRQSLDRNCRKRTSTAASPPPQTCSRSCSCRPSCGSFTTLSASSTTLCRRIFQRTGGPRSWALSFGTHHRLSADGVVSAPASARSLPPRTPHVMLACGHRGDTANFNHFVFGVDSPTAWRATTTATPNYGRQRLLPRVPKLLRPLALRRRMLPGTSPLLSPEAMRLHCRLTRQILKKTTFDELD